MSNQSAATLRSLESYKEMHMARAEAAGKGAELRAARTLTAARKAAFGEKHKRYEARKSPGSNK